MSNLYKRVTIFNDNLVGIAIGYTYSRLNDYCHWLPAPYDQYLGDVHCDVCKKTELSAINCCLFIIKKNITNKVIPSIMRLTALKTEYEK